MKTCTRCGEEKGVEEFPPRKLKRRITTHAACRACYRQMGNELYKRSAARRKTIRDANKVKINANHKFVKGYLSENPCVDCGEDDPIVLDFDHIEAKDKAASISKMVASGLSITTIESEIAKCEIRCANCHRRRTAKQFNWYAKFS